MLLLESTSPFTSILSAAILERRMRTLVPSPSTKAVAPTAVTFFLPPTKPRREERMRYETRLRSGSLTKITGNGESISKTEKVENGKR
jgi:hypothetical protein